MTYPFKLSIIIVSWNTAELLQQCLNSFLSDDYSNSLEVIVVDNNSSDDSVKLVKEHFPNIKIICNSENLGFAKANNQGIECARGEYILLLNSDTVICEKCVFEQMVTYMDNKPVVGACGCRLIFTDGEHQVGDAGFKPTFKTLINHTFFLSKIFPYKVKGFFLNYDKFQGTIYVDWISGADFLIRREILQHVGMLSEDTFMFAEDIEWGCRIRSYGYKIAYLADHKIIHLQGASSKKQIDQKNFSVLWLDNLRWLFKKYNKNHPIVYFDFIISLSFILRSVLYFFQYFGTQKEKDKQQAKKMLHCFRHILLKFGKPSN